jgi:hypothetical protein
MKLRRKRNLRDKEGKILLHGAVDTIVMYIWRRLLRFYTENFLPYKGRQRG